MMPGCVTDYTEEKALHICEQIAQGRPLTKICKEDGMPGVATVYRWLTEQPLFAERYTRAREDQADTMADELVAIADETPETETVFDKNGNPIDIRMHSAYVQWQKNRVDARKWVAAKLKPRKYGDKTFISGDPENPLKVENDPMTELLKNIEMRLQAKNEES